jgi:hypothetical protein
MLDFEAEVGESDGLARMPRILRAEDCDTSPDDSEKCGSMCAINAELEQRLLFNTFSGNHRESLNQASTLHFFPP